jgi:hypothetical protein
MTIKRDGLGRAALGGACALGMLLTVGAGSAVAQGADARAPWQAWTGCWEPVATSDAPAPAGEAPVVCFVPVAGTAAVEVISLVGDRVAERERIVLDAQRASGGEGCTGTETITASPDARRLYRTAEHSCEGSLRRRSTGMMAMLPGGEWLDAQSVTIVDFTDVHAVRYRPVAAPAAVETEVDAAREGRAMAIDAARTAAAAPVQIAQVVEATRAVAPEVVEAWLVEREQGFDLDARRLVELADAGVPGRVTDLMVALSHPQRFTVNRNLRKPFDRPGETAAAAPPVRTMRPGFGFGPSWYPGFGYGYGSRYGYGYGSGFSPYGYGYAARPVVIVVREPGEVEAAARGRAVPGRGYTRGSGSGTPSAPSGDRPRTTSTGSSGSSGTSSRPAAAPSDGSSGSSGSSGRTARPRPQSD